MKSEMHPGVVIGVVIVVIAVVGFLIFRGTNGGTVDNAKDMSPALRAKLAAVYGSGPARTPAPPGNAATR